MFLLYTHRLYTAAMTARTIKNVHCEKCECDYAYELIRRGSGQGSSAYGLNNKGAQTRAEKAARSDLHRKLVQGVDPVACPDCGWVQAAMIADLRRRAHRWVLTVCNVGAVVSLACALIAWLAANGPSKGPIDAAQLYWIWGMVFGGPVLAVMGWQIRRFWAGLIDPNRFYPQKPQPIPGVPAAFKPGDIQPVAPVAEFATAVAARQVQSAQQSARAQLGYEVTPPQVEPGGWLTVQLMNMTPPCQCCVCLNHTETLHPVAYSKLVKVPLRICDRCLSQSRRATMLCQAGIVATGLVLGLICGLLLSRSENFLVIVLTFTGFVAGILAAGLLTRWLVPAAASFSRFSPDKNTIRIRFRNRAYLHSFSENGRLV